MTDAALDRDGDEIDSMATDRYLDSLLLAHARGSDHAPASATLDPAVRFAADLVSAGLPRLHPSFRFEERLWNRLAAVARGEGAETASVHMFGARYVERDNDGAHLHQGAGTRPVRPFVVGGALTSALLSVVGGIYLAWRFRRPGPAPMVRAARAVGRTRLV